MAHVQLVEGHRILVQFGPLLLGVGREDGRNLYALWLLGDVDWPATVGIA